jgi:hypothetical protein
MVNNFALIVGAMKCGTTSLFQYLKQHPQVCPCEPKKEPDFFCDDDNYSKGIKWYSQLWSYEPGVHKIAMEGSTNYTKIRTTEVVERILETQSEFSLNFKFIYIMRNPLERIESQYTNGLRASWGKNMMDLEKGIDPKFIEISKYAKQISEYYKKFPANNILLLNFNDLKDDAPSVLKKICHFLNLDSSFEFKDTSKVYHPNQGKFIDGSIWPFVEPVSKFIPSKPRKAIRRKLGRKIKGNIKLSLEQRSFILNELRPDLEKLKGEYGVDISKWGIEV